ncbi:acyl-CoA thioesterase [Rhodospirillum sp. A1_3_36]|uniref:acyl-CoA thioesterase n=1 Tax=Rhodospirillum sp. A1_3_36 TaxID=3391666 RepID=UPI0039A69301
MNTTTGQSESRFIEMIFPEQANHYGTLFGGTALNLMGKAAVIAASRMAGRAVVMAASERIDFKIPVKVGQMLELTARVEATGRTSMTVLVEAIAETIGRSDRRLALQGRFVMVSVDENGHPVPVEPGAMMTQA